MQVAADMSRATADMDRWRAEQQHNAIKVPVEVDEKRFRDSLNRVTRSAGGGGGGFPLVPSLIFAGISQLPAAATAITNVAGALQQLAGAGGVVPGIFAAIGADVGTAKLALMGVGDAFKAVEKASDGSAKNVAAANEALAKLAPSAADFVKSVESLKPTFQSLQKDVQGKFFTGLGDEIKNLARADLPLLQKGLGGIATAFNQNLKQLGTTVGSAPSQGLLDRILGNTGDAQARLSKAIDPIVNAFGTLAAAGSDTLPRLADGVGKLADRFDHFILSADDSGKLSKWINDGITGFDHLGNTLLNIGKSFTALTQAAGGDGGLLKVLDDGSHKLSEFLNSTQGQDTLKRFFAEGREEIKQLIPILQSLPAIAQGVFQASKDAAGIWLPVLQDISGVLRDQPGLVRAIADAFLAWKFVGVITGVADAVKGITVALGLVGPAAAAAGTEAAAGLGPFSSALAGLAANPVFAALLAAGAFGAGIGPLLNAGPDANNAKAHQDFVDDYNRTKGAPVPAVVGPVQGPTLGPVGPGSGPQFAVSPPSVDPGSTDPNSGGRRAGPSYTPPTPGLLDKRNPFAGYAAGGPTPSGRGNGPTGGWISELHGDEWVLPAHARAAVGDKALWALTSGRSFAPGGYIDEHGNPVTPGPAPGGPGPVAPTPGGGGVQSAIGSFLSGIGGPIGNIAGLIQGANGSGSGSSGTKLTPGFAGLAQAGNDPKLLNQWGTQTGEWLGNFGAKTLTSFGTALWQGALGFFGLDNSILSPNNPWFQDASKTAGFFLGQDGPLAGSSSSDGSSPATPQQDGVQHLAADRQRVNAPDQLKQTPIAPNAKPGGAPVGGNQGIVYQAMINAGYGPDQWSSLQNLLNGESGFRNTAQNPSSTAYGMFQFLDSTWSGVGGAKTSDPGLQSQYGLAYIKQRYGTPAAAWSAWQSRSPHWYSAGGASRGPGGPTSDDIPAMLSNGEHVLTAADVSAMGGQAGVYAFRKSLHRAGGGGIMPSGVIVRDPRDDRWGWAKPGKQGGGKPVWSDKPGPGITGGPSWGIGGSEGRDDIHFPSEPFVPFDPYRRHREGVHALGDAVGYAFGGGVFTGLPPLPPKPFPRPPEARTLIPRPVAPTPSQIGPPQLQPPEPVAPPPPAQPGQPQEQPQTQVAPPGGPAPTAQAPSSYDHNLPAVNTAIESTASTLGSIAQTAAAIGSFGIAGAAGGIGAGLGGGGGGPSIQGLFQQAGKIAKNIVNVGSSFLVGNITPGTNANAYGEQLRPAQKTPQTAPWDSSRTYIFHGVDSRNIVDDLRTKDAQDQQARLAPFV